MSKIDKTNLEFKKFAKITVILVLKMVFSLVLIMLTSHSVNHELKKF